MIRDKAASPRLRWTLESYFWNAKGKVVRFSGYWVVETRGKIEVTAGEFDETELSDHSDWKEAWQNGDPVSPHGYLDPLSLLHDISRKIAGQISPAELAEASGKFHDGAPCPVNNLEDFARLIQLVVPQCLPSVQPSELGRFSADTD